MRTPVTGPARPAGGIGGRIFRREKYGDGRGPFLGHADVRSQGAQIAYRVLIAPLDVENIPDPSPPGRQGLLP